MRASGPAGGLAPPSQGALGRQSLYPSLALDYTKQPLLFGARKVLRYAGLYGVSRTAVKVRSQYHMTRTYSRLPTMDPAAHDDSNRRVGILGCGKFAYAMIAYYLTRGHGSVIRGAMDRNIRRAASLAQRYDLAFYTDQAAEVIDDPQIDLVYIASNHASHADYAVRALECGKHVHVEKPHVVSIEQLHNLCRAMANSGGSLRLGFNRPESPIGIKIAQALAAEPGAMMLNWFIAGHEIPDDHWYFKPEEGGRVLGNLCHWTDFVLRLVPESDRYPIKIYPARAGRSDCDIAVSYVFADGSIASLTFSAKGHAFEGVKERFAAHRGNTLIAMDDFSRLTIESKASKRTMRLRHRDHGHEGSILASYRMRQGHLGVPIKYVWETGELFLRTREALENSQIVTLDEFPGVEHILARREP